MTRVWFNTGRYVTKSKKMYVFLSLILNALRWKMSESIFCIFDREFPYQKSNTLHPQQKVNESSLLLTNSTRFSNSLLTCVYEERGAVNLI